MVTRKIAFQRVVLGVLKTSTVEEAENIILSATIGCNTYQFNLYTSAITCEVVDQPTELEMTLYQYGVQVRIHKDVVLRDFLIFDMLTNGYTIKGNGKIILADDYIPGIDTYIVRDFDIFCKNNNVKVPAKIANLDEFMENPRGGILNYMALNYYNNFDKAYNCRIRSFIRMAAKVGKLSIIHGNLVTIINKDLTCDIFKEKNKRSDSKGKLLALRIKNIVDGGYKKESLF